MSLRRIAVCLLIAGSTGLGMNPGVAAPVVVDVGAHIGCFSKRLHQRHPSARIVAVECVLISVSPWNCDLYLSVAEAL